MFNLDKFIANSVTYRPVSMFKADIAANMETLVRQAHHKSRKESWFILSLSKEEREEFGPEDVVYPQRGQDYLYPTTTAPSVPTTARVPPSRCSTSTSSSRKFDTATNFKRKKWRTYTIIDKNSLSLQRNVCIMILWQNLWINDI